MFLEKNMKTFFLTLWLSKVIKLQFRRNTLCILSHLKLWHTQHSNFSQATVLGIMEYKNTDILNIFKVCMALILHNFLATHAAYRAFSNSVNYSSVLAQSTLLNLESEINKQECLHCGVLMLEHIINSQSYLP